MTVIYFLIYGLFLLEVTKCTANVLPPKIILTSGTVEGVWKTSFEGHEYAAFEGIPYAKPPVGNLRFMEPQPVDPWTGVLKATRRYRCTQTSMNNRTDVSGEEDCLYLNVYVPKIDQTNLDVLAHIHGGGFMIGSAFEAVEPKYVMDKNWIFVSMNYRLGALGFLSTEDDTVPGNNGLKDQAFALKWIQQNIANFNGNPKSVTLTGFSAGAASVHFQYFSPISKGLFHRGHSISGTTLNPWAFVESPKKRAQQLAKALGCETDNSRKIVECLKQRPASLISQVTAEVMHPFNPTPYCPFSPVVEKNPKNAFLPEHPYKMLKEGKVLDVPWIASHTSVEGLMMLAIQHRFEEMDENWDDVGKYSLEFHETALPSRLTETAQMVREFYFSNGSVIDMSQADKIAKMFTDRLMTVNIHQAIQMQSQVTKSPVYYYEFSYEGSGNFKPVKHVPGASHGDDMIYLFGGADVFWNSPTQQDIEMKNILQDMLYSFVHTGIPTTQNIRFDPVEKDLLCLKISDPGNIKMETISDFTADRFWRNLGLLENENLFPHKDEL